MELALFIFAIAIVATLIALWEIQIEGPAGWAANLPTRRWNGPAVRRFTGGRPLTRYHLMLCLTLLVLVHLPILFSSWSWREEAKVIGFFIVMLTLEDFLWFVLNPAWGIRKFKKSPELWWHPRWFLGLPDYYWLTIPLGIIALLWGLR